MSAQQMEMISAIEIDPRLLMRANDAVNAKRNDDVAKEPGFAMCTVASELRGAAPPAVVAAVWFRLEALAQLLKDGGADCWVFGDEHDGGKLLNEVVFVAAARAPLIADGKSTVRFDADVFQRLALEAAESEGRA